MSDTGTARWLDGDQQASWRAFLSGTTRLFERLDRQLREHAGISLPEYEILVRLSEAPDRRLRMAELASSLAHSRSRVTHTVARLEAAGAVIRRACASDGRGVFALLTDEGMQMLVDAAPGHVGAVREYLVDIASPDDFEAVGRVFGATAEMLADDR
ncbi:MarR family transcriptional regulator [soil metagenome]